jgi:hypothetical protein
MSGGGPIVVVNKAMKQNMVIVKKLNEDNRKLHFNAAKSILLQHPGCLQSKNTESAPSFDLNFRVTSPNMSTTSKGQQDVMSNTLGSFTSVIDNYGSKGFQPRMNATKGSFYLPVKKSHFSQTMSSFEIRTSNFELPKIINPLLISKEQ